MKEEWRDIKGYENLYKISNLGRVKSLGRWVGAKAGKRKFKKESILKAGVGSSGYKLVSLTVNSKSKSKRVHQLVAESFLNHMACGYKLVVDHIDNNPLNNNVENLQLITQRENTHKESNRGTSEYVGVSFYDNHYYVRFWNGKKNEYLGRFKCELEASRVYQKRLADYA